MIIVTNLRTQPIAGGYRLSADVQSAQLPHELYFDITSDSAFACPDCGSASIQITAGEEFYVEAIDVES